MTKKSRRKPPKPQVEDITLAQARELLEVPLVTRRQAVAMARRLTGAPFGLSAVEKASMRGEGPPVEAKYGLNNLYKPPVFLEWAKTLIKPAPSARS